MKLGLLQFTQEPWNSLSKALCDLLESPVSKPGCPGAQRGWFEVGSEVMGAPHHNRGLPQRHAPGPGHPLVLLAALVSVAPERAASQ